MASIRSSTRGIVAGARYPDQQCISLSEGGAGRAWIGGGCSFEANACRSFFHQGHVLLSCIYGIEDPNSLVDHIWLALPPCHVCEVSTPFFFKGVPTGSPSNPGLNIGPLRYDLLLAPCTFLSSDSSMGRPKPSTSHQLYLHPTPRTHPSHQPLHQTLPHYPITPPSRRSAPTTALHKHLHLGSPKPTNPAVSAAMNRLPGPSFAVHPARTTHTHNAAVDTHAPRPSPGPPCISAIDETKLKIPSVIAKARGRAQDRARATLMARGPISAATGMAPAEKDQKDQKQRGPTRDINPEKKDSSANGREADSKKEEAKAPSAKAERRRRKKKARMLRVSAPPHCDAAPCRDAPRT